jgi:putative aldouronate transport system substrate-binding protein
MLKRTLLLVMAAVLLIGLVAGCSDGGATPTTTTTKATTTAEGTTGSTTSASDENFNETGYPIVNEKITVTSMFAPNPAYQGQPEDLAYWKELEEITNIHIEWTVLASSDMTALQLFMAAGDYPDFMLAYVWGQEQFTYGVEGKKFLDLTGLIDQYMPNVKYWMEKYPLAKGVITQSNGEIYTLPKFVGGPDYTLGRMFVRTDYLEKVGLGVPTTIDEFYNALVAIKDAGLTKGSAPLLTTSLDEFNWDTEMALFPAFGDFFEPDFTDDGTGKVVYNRMSDQYKRYLEFMNKLYSEQLLDPEYVTIDYDTAEGRQKDGLVAFSNGFSILEKEDFESGVIQLDCLEPLTSQYTNKKQVIAYPNIQSQGGAINKDTKYAKEIARMFDTIYSPEEVVPGSGFNNISMDIGMEGTNWTYTNAEKTNWAFMLPDDWTKSAWNYNGTHVTWGVGLGATVSNATNGDLGSNNRVRAEAQIAHNMPFAKDMFPDDYLKYTIEETNQIANILTDIKSFVMQARAEFISGTKPLSEWDAYVQQLKDMGIDEVLAIKQASYDRWNSN